MRFLAGAVLVLALLAGCAPPPTPEAKAPSVPADFPAAFYRQAAARGEPVYALDTAHSLLKVGVHSGGPLARLGHEHVVSSRELRGYVLLAKEPNQTRTDLYLPLDSLAVDDPALAGRTVLSPADIAATRRHMLDDVLEAPRHPFAVIHAGCSPDSPSCKALAAEVTLHGVTRSLKIPVEWHRDGTRLSAKGRFSIRHGDFGLVPYRVLGGVLQVAEEIDLDFQVEALPIAGGRPWEE